MKRIFLFYRKYFLMRNFYIAKISPYYIRCGSTIINSSQAEDIKK